MGAIYEQNDSCFARTLSSTVDLILWRITVFSLGCVSLTYLSVVLLLLRVTWILYISDEGVASQSHAMALKSVEKNGPRVMPINFPEVYDRSGRLACLPIRVHGLGHCEDPLVTPLTAALAADIALTHSMTRAQQYFYACRIFRDGNLHALPYPAIGRLFGGDKGTVAKQAKKFTGRLSHPESDLRSGRPRF
jgi:hypothetical protein